MEMLHANVPCWLATEDIVHMLQCTLFAHPCTKDDLIVSNDTGEAREGQGRSGKVREGQGRSEKVREGQGRSGKVREAVPRKVEEIGLKTRRDNDPLC